MSNCAEVRPLPVRPTNFLISLFIFFATSLLATPTIPAGAAEHHPGAHVHGIGLLNIAIDEKEVYIEMVSPAANITGFEHEPVNAEQEKAVHLAITELENGDKLYTFNSKAGCSLFEAKVDSSMSLENHGDHAHTEAGHGTGEGHSEFTATYLFKCSRPQELTTVDVQHFTVFPGFEKLDVQLLTPSGQSGTVLKPGNSRITL